MKLTYGVIDTMEVPCGACQITQKFCQRKQNLINLIKLTFVGKQARQAI
jgi:hypothetical protein